MTDQEHQVAAMWFGLGALFMAIGIIALMSL